MSLVLLLLAPLVEAAACGLLRSRRWMERVSLISATINLVLAVRLVQNVARFQTVSVFDGFLYADALSALVILLTAFVSFVCAIYAVGYFRTDLEKGSITLRRLKEYYILTPLFVFALFLVALANNLGIMWVAIEGSTLASVLLIAFYNQKTSLEAAWKYIIIGSMGISMALFGTLLTYYAASHVVGTESIEGLNWTRLILAAPSLNPKALRLAFLFILMGYGTKAGIAPMHTWKPDSYSEAPAPSAAILAAAVLNCALYGILRFHILASRCLGPEFSSGLLLWFGLGSLLIATPFILVQTNFRRLLAYSSIDHTGIMLVGFGVGGSLGPFGALLHMFYHAITKPLLFFCAGNVQQQFGTATFRKVGGVDPFDASDSSIVSGRDPGGDRHSARRPVPERVDGAQRFGPGPQPLDSQHFCRMRGHNLCRISLPRGAPGAGSPSDWNESDRRVLVAASADASDCCVDAALRFLATVTLIALDPTGGPDRWRCAVIGGNSGLAVRENKRTAKTRRLPGNREERISDKR